MSFQEHFLEPVVAPSWAEATWHSTRPGNRLSVETNHCVLSKQSRADPATLAEKAPADYDRIMGLITESRLLRAQARAELAAAVLAAQHDPGMR